MGKALLQRIKSYLQQEPQTRDAPITDPTTIEKRKQQLLDQTISAFSDENDTSDDRLNQAWEELSREIAAIMQQEKRRRG